MEENENVYDLKISDEFKNEAYNLLLKDNSKETLNDCKLMIKRIIDNLIEKQSKYLNDWNDICIKFRKSEKNLWHCGKDLKKNERYVRLF